MRAGSGYYSAAFIAACRRSGARFSVAARMDPAVTAAIAAIGDGAWTPVRRVRDQNHKAAAGTGELFPVRRYHPVFTDSAFAMPKAEEQHRDHAIIEQVSADLSDGPLAHAPSGKFAGNAAWLALAAIAHNLTRAAGAPSVDRDLAPIGGKCERAHDRGVQIRCCRPPQRCGDESVLTPGIVVVRNVKISTATGLF